MPSLICDLRPEAAELALEYQALCAAGEALALFWPAVSTLPPGFSAASTATQLHACFEDEVIAVVQTPAFPAWLHPEEFLRVLLVSTGAGLLPAERAIADSLLQAGCEAVEVAPPARLVSLSQSWHSGRRTGRRLLRPPTS